MKNLSPFCQSIFLVIHCIQQKIKIWDYGSTPSSLFLGMFTVSVRPVFIQLRDRRRHRQHLTHKQTVKAVNTPLSSQLDFYNSLFRSLSGFNVTKLQSLQNSLAWFVTNTTRYSYITPVLKRLHWFTVQQWPVFKTATIRYTLL